MAVEVGTAYISLQATTKDLDKTIKAGLDGSVRHADAAGGKIGSALASAVGSHLDKAGSKSGDAFSKTFTPKVQGAGKNAMQGLAQAMLGGAEGIGSQLGGGISGALVSTLNKGANAAVGALSKIGTAGGGLSSTMMIAGTGAAAGVALIATAAVGATKALYDVGAQWDSVADGITFKTGLVGEKLDEVKESIKSIASDTAASVGDIANIGATLIKGFKLDPKSMGFQALTQQLAQYNAAAQDAGAEAVNIKEFTKAMNNMKIGDDPKAMIDMFDSLYAVTQNSTLGMNELLTTMRRFGPQLEQFNIPVQQGVQILAAMEQAGMDANTAVLGFRTAWGKLKDDPDPAGALRTAIAQIRDGLQSTDEKAQEAARRMATDFFGNKAGGALAEGIAQGNLELDNFNTKASQTGITVGEMASQTEDLSQEWQKFTNTLSGVFEPVATRVFGFINDALEMNLGLVGKLIDGFSSLTSIGGNIATGDPLAPGPEASAGILGSAAGGSSSIGLGGPGGNAAAGILGSAAGGLPAGVGGGGRGWMNYAKTSAYLDRLAAQGGMRSVGSSLNLKPNAAALKDQIATLFPQVSDIGGWRKNDRYPDHPSGRAIDVMIPPALVGTPEGKALGDRINQFALQSGLAQYTMWQQQQFKPGQGAAAMGPRGSSTANHMDHVHIYTMLNDLLGGAGTYDTGGWLPPGYTIVKNATGQDELVLNPEQQQALADSGVDPSALLNGTHQGSGAKPGPQQPVSGEDAQMGDTLGRVMGYLPAAANTGGVAGTSSLAGFLNMGNQVVSGLIDTGASAAQTALGAATAAGTFGASAAAGPAAGAAAGYGIQLAATQGKRISSYWFQAASILADSLVAQAFPFGAPRWIGYDYTQFAPQLNISQIGTTTVEKAMQSLQNQQQGKPVDPNNNPGGPVNPELMPGMQGVGQPVPTFGTTSATPIESGAPQQAATATLAPGEQAPIQSTSPAAPAPDQQTPMDPLKNLFGYDQGGWLEPGQIGINMTGRPEPVLTPKQWDALAASPPKGRDAPTVKIDAIYGMSPEDVAKQIDQQQRLAAMRFSGRPY